MKSIKKLLCIPLILCLSLNMSILSFAKNAADVDPYNDTPIGYVTMSVESFTLGRGYMYEPMRVPFFEGDNFGSISARFFGEEDVDFSITGDYEFMFDMYVANIKDDARDAEDLNNINPPSYILEALANIGNLDFDDPDNKEFPKDLQPASLEDLIAKGRSNKNKRNGWLGEFDYYRMSGWMYSQNNVFNGYGIAKATPKDGDVLRWQFTLYGYGADLGSRLMSNPVVVAANKDALTRQIGEINAAANKAEILAKEGMQAAYDHAYALLMDIETPQADVDKALTDIQAILSGATPVIDPEDPTPTSLSLNLSVPEQTSGVKDTEFNLIVNTDGWTEDAVRLIDGVVTIPGGLEVVDVKMSDALTGGALNYNLSENTLRFAYISEKDLEELRFAAANYPAELMVITVRLTEDIVEETDLSFAVEKFTLKERSDKEATSFDLTKGLGTTKAIPFSQSFTAVSRVLYTGDDSDLIPASKKAVSVDFVNLSGTPNLAFEGIDFYYSPELSAKKGTVTYAALVDVDLTSEDLNDTTKYSVDAGNPENIRFADTNDDDTINAQDALNTLTAWLRKTDAPEGKGILVMNVTADPMIDTYDVLSVMEHYINATEFAVIGK